MAAGACSGWGALPPAWPWRRSIPRSAHPVPRWPLPASPACVSADPMLRSAPTVGPAAWWPLAPLVRSSVPLPPQSPAIAGVLVTFSVEWLDARIGVDDPAGSISVHAVAGLWGLQIGRASGRGRGE